MIWVDACAQALYDCRILIKMAEALNKPEYIIELDEEADLLFKVINEKLWDEKTGFYYDLWKNGEFN
jgi:rhamnogalacturonyl hydrolase YesR